MSLPKRERSPGDDARYEDEIQYGSVGMTREELDEKCVFGDKASNFAI